MARIGDIPIEDTLSLRARPAVCHCGLDPQSMALWPPMSQTTMDPGLAPDLIRGQVRDDKSPKETDGQAFGSVTPRWPWYLPPRSL